MSKIKPKEGSHFAHSQLSQGRIGSQTQTCLLDLKLSLLAASGRLTVTPFLLTPILTGWPRARGQVGIP